MSEIRSPTQSTAAQTTGSLGEKMEDAALQRVSAGQRMSALALTWMPVGIVTTLAVLLYGSIVTAIVGVPLAIVAGVVMAVFASVLGWLIGDIARREGVSSTVISRFYGLGVRGSALASVIIAFGIIAALALENVLLYEGTRFAFGLADTWPARIGIYGVLTIGWIVLTIFGTRLVQRVSSLLVIAFLGLLGFMIWKAGFASGVPISTTLTHGPLLPGLGNTGQRFEAALVILASTATLLAVIQADYARWARSRRDVGVISVAGGFMCELIVVLIGAIVVFGSAGLVSDYLIKHGQATSGTAQAAVANLSQNNTGAYFIILSTVVGFLLMYAAQVKAQVLNTYTGALSLTNFFDVLFRWRPGRAFMVVASCLAGLVLVAAGILPFLKEYLAAMGAFLSAFAGVLVADYYIVRRRKGADRSRVEDVNWAGVLTVTAGSGLSLGLYYTNVFTLAFAVAIVFSLISYPLLRLTILPAGKGTRWIESSYAVVEAEELGTAPPVGEASPDVAS